MKHSFTIFILMTVCVSGLFQPVAAVQLPEQKDPAAQLLMQTLVECGKQKLGGEAGIDLAYAMGEQANRQIVAFCQAGNIKKAYDTAHYYASTEEGKAVMECASQLKPLVMQPAVQKILGPYRQMVTDVTNGIVPQNVCAGVKRGGYR